MIIGTFTKKNEGYSGKLITLTHSQALTFVPAEKGVDYRVMIGAIEVGAAWKKTGKESGKAYLSVKLDSPFLPASVNCGFTRVVFPLVNDFRNVPRFFDMRLGRKSFSRFTPMMADASAVGICGSVELAQCSLPFA